MITDDDNAAVSQTLLRVVDHPERGAVIDFYGYTCDKCGVFREHRRNSADRLINAPHVEGGGRGPHDPSMEARVSRLEEDFKEFRSELRAFRSELIGIRTDIGGVRADLGEMKGRVTHLPTTWVMLTGLLGSQVTLAGLVDVVARALGKG